MTEDRLQPWIDKHFQRVVPILAVIGCCRWVFTSNSIFAFSVTILPFFCGSIGCYFWALYLRKSSPFKWLFLGLFPALPQLYLFGWHRCLIQKKARTEKALDCPRCGTYLGNSADCPNCSWNPSST